MGLGSGLEGGREGSGDPDAKILILLKASIDLTHFRVWGLRLEA